MAEKPIAAMRSARDAKITDIILPAYMSVKYDGIRCMGRGGKPMSNSGLVLPNRYLQSEFEAWKDQIEHMDGELIIGDPAAPDCYTVTLSGISTQEGNPPFKYYVFDYIEDINLPFEDRLNTLRMICESGDVPDWLVFVLQIKVNTHAELEQAYLGLVEAGHEGVITRHPKRPYKYGRSTLSAKEQGMVKFKPREDGEGRVVGIGELERNNNEATIGGRGETKRSHHKAGKSAGGTLGYLIVEELATGLQFRLGTFKGLKQKDKDHIFNNQDEYIGRHLIFEHMPVGRKDLPRIPSFKGWRAVEDLPPAGI